MTPLGQRDRSRLAQLAAEPDGPGAVTEPVLATEPSEHERGGCRSAFDVGRDGGVVGPHDVSVGGVTGLLPFTEAELGSRLFAEGADLSELGREPSASAGVVNGRQDFEQLVGVLASVRTG